MSHGQPRSEWIACANPSCTGGRRVTESERRLAEEKERTITCSVACRAAVRRHLPTWNLLQKRVLALMDRERLSLSAFAVLVDVDRSVLKTWFAREGSALRKDALARLAIALGIPLEQALRESGGKTTEDKKRAAAVANLTAIRGDEQLWRKTVTASRSAQRGQPKDRSVVERRQRTRLENGAHERTMSALSAAAEKDAVRVRRSLQLNVAKYRTQHAGQNPPPTKIKAWEGTAAKRFALPEAVVRGYWKEPLEQEGLKGKGGRPANESRCRLIERLMAKWPRRADGDLADGFWPMALKEVREREGQRAPSTPEALADWWRSHRLICPRLHASAA